MKKLVLQVSVLLMATAQLAMANPQTSTKLSDLDLGLSSNEKPMGFVPFAALGVSAVEFDSNLTDRDGIAGNARLIGSYYAKNNPFVFDGGLGVDTADLNNQTVHSALVEAAARYRFTDDGKWHAGPVANLHLGNGVGTDYGSSTEDLASFVGLQVMRDFAVGQKTIIRGGLKAMTDIGIQDSVANKFLAEVQVGAVSPTKITEAHTQEEKVEEVADEEVVEDVIEEVIAEKEEVVIVEEAKTVTELETKKMPRSIFFGVGSKTVKNEGQRDLAELIEMIRTNKESIQSIDLIGFADKTGQKEKNDVLALERAKYVSQKLKEAGIESTINTQSGGTVADDQLGFNRRVDINVVGKKGSSWITE